MFNCGPVFHANYLSTADVVINQGGTDSGKTIAILQCLCMFAVFTKPPVQDPVISVVNKSVPDSKKGAYRTFEGIYASNKFLQSQVIDWNSSDRVITFKNGWIMEFIGAIDVQSAKQGKRQYLFVNEANGIDWEIFWQYSKRTRVRTFIDYNPSEPFWAHDKLIGTTRAGNDLNADVQLIISDHRHNPFLSDRDHEKTENIRDPELHKVYARGKTGKLIGLIFPNWKMCTTKEFLAIDKKGYGVLDFGYTNDPTAANWCKADLKKKHLYVHELCYKPGVSMPDIKRLFYGCGFSEETPVYCDYDFEAVRQLRKDDAVLRKEFKKGTLMAIMAKKGPGSVKAGIHLLNKEWQVFFTETSENIDFERKRYMWELDPVTKKPTNEPVDQFNHHMDAIRIGHYSRYSRAE